MDINPYLRLRSYEEGGLLDPSLGDDAVKAALDKLIPKKPANRHGPSPQRKPKKRAPAEGTG